MQRLRVPPTPDRASIGTGAAERVGSRGGPMEKSVAAGAEWQASRGSVISVFRHETRKLGDSALPSPTVFGGSNWSNGADEEGAIVG